MITSNIFNALNFNTDRLRALGCCHACGSKTTLFCDHGTSFDHFTDKKAADYAEKAFYIENEEEGKEESQRGQDDHTLNIKLPQLRPDFTQKEAKLEEVALQYLFNKIKIALDQFKNYLRQMGLDVAHYNANIKNGKIVINIPDLNHRDQFKQFLNSRIREKNYIPKNNHPPLPHSQSKTRPAPGMNRRF